MGIAVARILTRRFRKELRTEAFRRLWWRRGELNESGLLKTRKLLILVFHQFH